jgi:hypothetical protein
MGCIACPGSTTTTFNFNFNGDTNHVTVAATTEQAATSVQQCLLKFAPIVDFGNW